MSAVSPLVYKGYHQFNYPHFYYKGTPLNEYLYSYEMIDYITQKRFLKSHPLVCEIGAGNGLVAKEILSNIQECKYIIFDLPEVLTRSHFLLSTRFPDKKIASMREFKECQYDMERLIKEYDIIFLPCWYVPSIPENMKVDLWVNTHSLGEMPVEIAKRYCEVIDRTGEAFISINRDRDVSFGKEFPIYDTRRYLSAFKTMKVREFSYPMTSNELTIRPSYVRLFLEP